MKEALLFYHFGINLIKKGPACVYICLCVMQKCLGTRLWRLQKSSFTTYVLIILYLYHGQFCNKKRPLGHRVTVWHLFQVANTIHHTVDFKLYTYHVLYISNQASPSIFGIILKSFTACIIFNYPMKSIKMLKLLWLFPQPLLIAIWLVSSAQVVLQSDIDQGGTRG